MPIETFRLLQDAPLLLAYLALVVPLVAGETLFLRTKRPDDKRRWRPRIALLNALIVVIFTAATVASWQAWATLPLYLAVSGFFGYVTVTKYRVCERCGVTVQPRKLFLVAAQACPNCNTALSRAPLFFSSRNPRGKAR